MKMKVVDLYQEYGLHKPEGAVGQLTCWLQTPSQENYPNRQHPAVLVLPGGAYAITAEHEGEPVATAFYAKGYCAFVLEYSCTPLLFPTALREAVLAMDYIRRNADAFAVHPDRITAVGFSAGGHLCGTLATMYDCPEVADLVTGNQARPNAVGLCYPVLLSWGKTQMGSCRNLCGDDQALIERLSLDRLARSDMPPVYLWHTRQDSCVSVRNSLEMALKLEELGIPFAMNIYGKGDHGMSLANERIYDAKRIPPHTKSAENWLDCCVEFFAEQGIVIEK